MLQITEQAFESAVKPHLLADNYVAMDRAEPAG